jgi:hypothetical protein
LLWETSCPARAQHTTENGTTPFRRSASSEIFVSRSGPPPPRRRTLPTTTVSEVRLLLAKTHPLGRSGRALPEGSCRRRNLVMKKKKKKRHGFPTLKYSIPISLLC